MLLWTGGALWLAVRDVSCVERLSAFRLTHGAGQRSS